MTTRRWLLAAGSAIIAGFVAVLAHDVRAWGEALERGDARFASSPATAHWEARTWLPDSVTRRLLALDDDLALRGAERAYVVARRAPRGLDNGARRARLRASAELALAEAVSAGSTAQAARAGNLLGILVATGESGADASATDRRAGELFEAAVRADPDALEAKANLELLLRRIRVVGTREGSGSGSGDRGASRRGAGSSPPGSGY